MIIIKMKLNDYPKLRNNELYTISKSFVQYEIKF